MHFFPLKSIFYTDQFFFDTPSLPPLRAYYIIIIIYISYLNLILHPLARPLSGSPVNRSTPNKAFKTIKRKKISQISLDKQTDINYIEHTNRAQKSNPMKAKLPNKYTARVKRDAGMVYITVWALTITQAIKQICETENCPERSILEVKRTQKGIEI